MEKKKIIEKGIYIALFVSILINIFLLYSAINQREPNDYLYEDEDYSLINPEIAKLDVEKYTELKEEYTASYTPMKEKINETIGKAQGHFGFYFEDLTFHSWCGINEREQFTPASLLKTSVVSSVLHKVEEDELSLNQEVTISEDYLNQGFGDLYKDKGKKFTIKELIEITIKNSDNTAVKELQQFVEEDDWAEARLGMGLPLRSITDVEKGTFLSPKEFSNIFRSLYFSGFLHRTFSNWLLILMTETNFNDGIPKGVPKDVKVAHKVGIWDEKGSVHDCGIVYAKRPYILCIMSSNTTVQEGDRVIDEISKIVYDYTNG